MLVAGERRTYRQPLLPWSRAGAAYPRQLVMEVSMSVARITELSASSKKSFDDALQSGLKRATKTLKNVTAAWISSQEVELKNGKINEYRVRMKVTFVLDE
jgi:flavin-binding protein dodecin